MSYLSASNYYFFLLNKFPFSKEGASDSEKSVRDGKIDIFPQAISALIEKTLIIAFLSELSLFKDKIDYQINKLIKIKI